MKTKLCYISIQILFSIVLFTDLNLLANDSSLYDKYLNYQKKEISKSKILESEWLRLDLDYVKITTTKDGIARLAMKDILSFEPKWEGKNSIHLILLYKANDYPCYLKDNDGLISNDDTLYFIGKRAAGDTTWYENYTNQEPFFLTYDEGSDSKRLNLIEQSIDGTNLVNSVPIDTHIEEEHYYNAGKELYDTYTSTNEGWYWDMISPATDWAYGSTFSYNIFLDLNPGDELNLYLIFKSSADTLYNSTGSNIYPEYNLTFYFNNDSIDNRIFSRAHKDSFYIHLTYDNTIKGYNNIKIVANENHPRRNAEINIDYITLKGTAKPFANTQHFNSRIENLTNKSLVKVPNFQSNWIVGIDSLNDQIFFSTSEVQNNAYISLKKKERGLFFFGFRNNICYDTIDNFHLIIIPYSNPDSVIFYHNWYFSTDFKNLVDSAESNSIIILAINETNYFAQDAINFIIKNGGTLTSKFSDKSAYYFIFQKDKKVIDEDLIQLDKYAKTISFNNLNLIKNLFTANLVLPNSNSIIFLDDESKIEKPTMYKVNKPYLRNQDNQAEVVVIYNNYFKTQTEDYINYRSKTTGLKFLAVDVEDIYNEFNYGKKGVQCIKDYLIYAYNNWKIYPLKYLGLFGNASWDSRKIMSTSIATDFVPIYGFPPSDFWYSLLDDNLNPDIGVGRISASTLTDAENYIKKLKIYDALPDEPWMKNFLFLSGGYNPDEIRLFALQKYMFFDEPIELPPFCGTTDSIVKIYYQDPVSERQGGEIREKINNGALWVNYLGHANAASFDFDGWQAFRLNNYPKFSFFSTLSCNTGAHAEPAVINSRNEDYLFYPDKGFIGSVGSATWGWVDENRWIVQKMVENLADSTSSLVYMSDLINYGKKSLANQEAPLYSKFHFTLIGDPLLKLHTSRIPNLYVYPDELTIVNNNNSKMIHTSDSLAYVNCVIYNNGYQTKHESKVILIDTYQNKSDTISNPLPIICFGLSMRFTLDISNKPGQHEITIVIDPENLINLEKPQNRIFKTSFYVYSENLIILDPLAGWNVNKFHPIFRLIDPNSKPNTHYYFSIIDEETGNTIKKSTDDEIIIKENYLDWQPNIEFTKTRYIFEAYYTFGENQTSEKTNIPFYATDNSVDSIVNYKLNSMYDFNRMEFTNTKVDTLNKAITIKDNLVHYHLVSASRDNSIRWGNIEIGDKVYVDNQFALGFNIVTLPIYNDGSLGTYKRFDTWGSHGDNWQLDSVGFELVRYLRDSIPDDSYLFIATCDRSFRILSIYQAFDSTSLSSMDSLRAVLRKYGSALIDSIKGPLDWVNTAWNTWPHSFVMIGKKGWKPGEAIEAMNPQGDSSLIDGYLPLYQMDGEVISEILGPSLKWKNLTLNTDFGTDHPSNSQITFQILGDNSLNNVLYEKNVDNSIEEYDLSKMNLDNYKYLQIKAKLKRTDISANPSVKGFTADFIPAPEFAMIKSKTIIKDSIKMRGIPSTMLYAFENLSLRTPVDSILYNIINYTQSGSYQVFQSIHSNFNPNSEIFDSLSLSTDLLSNVNHLTSIVNPNSNVPEPYNFNNTVNNNFYVFEDTTKPIIQTTFDGKEVSNGDFVAGKPLITISVYDNTPYQITDSTKIEVYINGLFITPLNVNYYEFKSIQDGSELKAILKIIPNDLEYGEDTINPSNNIRVIAFDPAGNTDTVLYKVNVMKNNILQDLSTFPNPAADKVNFKFKFLGTNTNEPGKIQIYNLNGFLMKTLAIKTQIGENIIPCDLFDSNGNIFLSGVYFYRIDMNAEFYTEPKLGMFVITR